MDLYKYAFYKCKADPNSRFPDETNKSFKESKSVHNETGGMRLPVVYKLVCVNGQYIFNSIYEGVIQELRECVLELCRGAFTFDYSYNLSRNVQAKMKQLRFQKKNI
jgi:hypothetical protein